MKDNNPGVLVKDFIKKHLKIEEDLQNRINELETELKNIQGTSEDNDYLLYKEILKIMSNSIEITYESDGLYYLSMAPTHMNSELLQALLVELKKYRSKENPFDDVQLFDDEQYTLISQYDKGIQLNYNSNPICISNNLIDNSLYSKSFVL